MPPEQIHLSLYGNRGPSTQFLATVYFHNQLASQKEPQSLDINAAHGTAGRESGDELISTPPSYFWRQRR